MIGLALGDDEAEAISTSYFNNYVVKVHSWMHVADLAILCILCV